MNWFEASFSEPLLKTADRIDWLRSQGYPQKVLDVVQQIYPASDPKRRHVVWLANMVMDFLGVMTGHIDPRREPENPKVKQALDSLGPGNLPVDTFRYIIDWASQAVPPPNLMPMNFTGAYEAAKQWHEQMVAKDDEDMAGQYKGQKVFDLPGGWWIAQLTPADCQIEGELMGHCVGGYARGVAEGKTGIYSLRDPKGMPHATIEMNPLGSATEVTDKITGWEVTQVQGKQNREPIPEYKKMLAQWFASLELAGQPPQWADPQSDEDIAVREYASGRDDYGIVLDPFSSRTAKELVDKAFEESFYNRGNDFSKGWAEEASDSVVQYILDCLVRGYKKAIPDMERAIQHFEEEAGERFQEWAGDIPELAPPDEDNYDKAGFAMAEQKYEEALKYYENEDSGLQFGNMLYTKLDALKKELQAKGLLPAEPAAVQENAAKPA